MTTLNQTWDYTCAALCDKVGLFSSKTLLRNFNSGRQMAANQELSVRRVDWY